MAYRDTSSISDDEWTKAADLYELGLKNLGEIAATLGVSVATVSRRLKQMGCVKGSRVHQTVADLEALLDRRAQRARRLEAAKNSDRRKNREAADAFAERLVRTIIAADKAGKLAELGPAMKKMRRSLGA